MCEPGAPEAASRRVAAIAGSFRRDNGNALLILGAGEEAKPRGSDSVESLLPDQHDARHGRVDYREGCYQVREADIARDKRFPIRSQARQDLGIRSAGHHVANPDRFMVVIERGGDDVAGQVFVDEKLHATSSPHWLRRAANKSACSMSLEVRNGKATRMASLLSPAATASTIAYTGSLVPLITGCPSMTVGSTAIRSNAFMPIMIHLDRCGQRIVWLVEWTPREASTVRRVTDRTRRGSRAFPTPDRRLPL